MKPPGNNWIALIFGFMAFGMALVVFSMSRNDPGLRMAALVAATSTGAGLLAVSSTLLTGKDLTKPPSDMPPNSSVTQTSTTSVGAPPPDPTQVPPTPPKTGV